MKCFLFIYILLHVLEDFLEHFGGEIEYATQTRILLVLLLIELLLIELLRGQHLLLLVNKLMLLVGLNRNDRTDLEWINRFSNEDRGGRLHCARRGVNVEHFLRLGAEQIDAHACGAQLCRGMERVEALYELLEHELLDVRLVRVEYLIPYEKQPGAVEFGRLGVADVYELLYDATNATHLPSLMQLLRLQDQNFLRKIFQLNEIFFCDFGQRKIKITKNTNKTDSSSSLICLVSFCLMLDSTLMNDS